MAVFAVDITSLQKDCRPVTRTIHTAEGDDPVHYCFHLTYLSLQNMSVSGSSQSQCRSILKHCLAVCQFFQFGALNKKTQIITPTLLGENIFDVVSVSIRSLLNPELTASWEKGLTYVAEGQITQDEYMGKLEHFVRSRTEQVLGSRQHFAMRPYFEAAAAYYKKTEKTPTKQKGE